MPHRPKGKPPSKVFRVWCGDEACHFRYSEKFRRTEQEIVDAIAESMAQCRKCGCQTDFAKGLVLEDEDHVLWEPHIQVTFKLKEEP